jgi:phthiocerol/phenolphthiocerol synthesis type-I polyketide synthase D
VVAVPGGGGTAIRFRFLADALGGEQPLLVVEPRGMHRRGRPDRTVGHLAAHVVAEVDERLRAGAPVVLVGYSASGPVAYEAARRLRADGRTVHLVLLDTAPTLRGMWPGADPMPTIRTADRAQLPKAVLRSLAFRLSHLTTGLRRFRLEQFPGRARFDVERYMAFQRIMVRASRTYTPPPATFPATLVHVDAAGLVPQCRTVITDLAVVRVPGDHGSMLEPPHVFLVAEAIASVVDATTAAARTDGATTTPD